MMGLAEARMEVGQGQWALEMRVPRLWMSAVNQTRLVAPVRFATWIRANASPASTALRIQEFVNFAVRHWKTMIVALAMPKPIAMKRQGCVAGLQARVTLVVSTSSAGL
tara:strand:- start:1247 stop:1573 length:327 start_codon:yes stop_codon:yes gene_type:complete